MVQNGTAASRASRYGNPLAFGRLLASLLTVVLLLQAGAVFALPPQRLLVNSPDATLENGIIMLHLDVTVDNKDGLLALLKDGAVLELETTASIERERAFWLNAQAARSSFSSTLVHEPLTRDFVVLVPTPDGVKEIRDRSLDRLLDETWRQLTFPLAFLDDIRREEPAEVYSIGVSIALRHTEVPPWLEKSSVFWSAEVVPQESLRFSYHPPGIVPE